MRFWMCVLILRKRIDAFNGALGRNIYFFENAVRGGATI